MLTGCIKEQLPPSWLKFNLLLETVDLDDEIGHLFVVDIKFVEKRATEWECMYSEILTRIIEKQKILEANHQSLYQPVKLLDKINDDKPKSYHCTKKVHATMFLKKFISLYLEDLTSSITRCCWKRKNLSAIYVRASAF